MHPHHALVVSDEDYLSPAFLDAVEQRGSEPARYAFADARVLASSMVDLQGQLERIARYRAPIRARASRASMASSRRGTGTSVKLLRAAIAIC
jgi:hypothetical protein